MQIKVTLDQENYKYLKTNSQQHRRTLSAELNTILDQYIGKKEKIPEEMMNKEDLSNDPYYDPNF